MPYIVLLIVLLIASPVWASRDVASTDYMDGGTAANTAMSAPFTVAIMFKPDAIGTMQVMISRAVSALNNGWDFRIEASGALSLFNYETDSATGTSTTAPSAGTWYGLAAIMTGSAGSGTVKFVRFTPGTDTLAWVASPSRPSTAANSTSISLRNSHAASYHSRACLVWFCLP